MVRAPGRRVGSSPSSSPESLDTQGRVAGLPVGRRVTLQFNVFSDQDQSHLLFFLDWIWLFVTFKEFAHFYKCDGVRRN